MKDPRVEQWLDKAGVQWHYEANVPLSEVDEDASLKNQARFKAINSDHVTELAIQVLDGYELPALVAYRSKQKKLIIVSGNHRFKAYQEAVLKKADFYVVDIAHPWVIERITMSANMIESILPLTMEERIEHAMYMVNKLNMTAESAGREMCLAKSTLGTAMHAEEVKSRLVKMGVEEVSTLPTGTKAALWRIKQDSALLAAAKLAVEAKLSTAETVELSNRLQKSANTEKAQQGVIKEFCTKYADKIALVAKGRLSFHVGPKERLKRALNTINSIGGRPESVQPLEIVFVRKIQRAIKILEGLTHA